MASRAASIAPVLIEFLGVEVLAISSNRAPTNKAYYSSALVAIRGRSKSACSTKENLHTLKVHETVRLRA